MQTISRGAPSSEKRTPPREVIDSIPALIAKHSLAAPESLAVSGANVRLTFAELEQRSNQLASYLRELGAKPESCVGLFFARSVDFVVAALAAMKTGAAYLPLDPATPRDRAAFILDDADVPIVLTHRGKTQDWAANARRIVELDGADAGRIAAQPAKPLEIECAASSLVYVIYTSGSTGQPKGVEITHANLLNLIDWHNAAFNVTSADRASQVAGLGFDAAAWEIWPHLTAGASVHIADELTRLSPHTLREWLIAEGITISFVPTVLAEQLLHTTWPAGGALRTLLTGADTLHRRPADGLPFVFVNNYGPTECTVVSTSGTVTTGGVADGKPSIGRPISNASALVLDEALRPVAPGAPGELCIAGALVGRGYRNNPQMTARRFVTYSPPVGEPLRVYRTGDRVRMLENGEIEFLGRLDDQVKIRGFRIELGEIVASLDRCPGVEASAVVARDAVDGPMLAAYIIAATDARLNASDLRDFLSMRLPGYMIPAQFVKLSAMPLTPNGKLDKSALPAPSADNLIPGRYAPVAAAAPASDLEQRIGEMVAALLNRPSVNYADNFFMVGGHSMLGVQLVARLRDAFGVKLTLRQLFGAPTVSALSAEVARLSHTEA